MKKPCDQQGIEFFSDRLMKMICSIIVLLQVSAIKAVTIDLFDCGIDNEPTVDEGLLDVSEYPWLGILYYEFRGENGETRSVTTVSLIHREFVVGAAADIGPIPKKDFRKKTRVLLGEDWKYPGRRVRNYIIHPEYRETYNTICLVQLKDDVKNPTIRPLCPPPTFLKSPEFFVVKVRYDADKIEKKVIKVVHIPGQMCKDFYVAANLYAKMMRPPHVACAVEIKTKEVCVWSAGSALVSRDAWGRWQLLGVGVRGPGCGAPSRFLDMMSYYPWIEDSLSKFRELSISKLSPQKFVLRYSGHETSGGISPSVVGKRLFQRFGACDPEEKQNLLYREVLSMRTNHETEQSVKYNLTLLENVEYTCLTLELVNASSESEMNVVHQCTRNRGGPSCYRHQSSRFDLSIIITFGATCLFELAIWGHFVKMDLLDIQEWKWREGEYYEDFTMQKVEYRGPTDMTGFGFEPLDKSEWVPEYDLWTTTQKGTTTPKIFTYILPEHARIYSTLKRKKPIKYRPTTTASRYAKKPQKPPGPNCIFWHICWHKSNIPKFPLPITTTRRRKG